VLGEFSRKPERSRGVAATAKLLFGESVLPGLIRHHDDAPAHSEAVEGLGQRGGPRVELTVDFNPKRLKNTLGRVALVLEGVGSCSL
jgi:hypothetical protein